MKAEITSQRSAVSVRTAALALAALLLALGASVAQGQTFTIDWLTFDGGGGSSSAGIYAVSGTIGQPDAGPCMNGGNYSLAGGFWALSAVQPPPAPMLSVKLTTTNTVLVYWPSPSTSFSLEVSTDLPTANWVTPAETVQDNGTTKYIIVNPRTGNRFYRLKYP